MKKSKRPHPMGQKKAVTKSQMMSVEALSLEAQGWLQEAAACLTKGDSTTTDDSRLVAELAQLTAQEIPTAVQQLAKETGDRGLPLLQYMTTLEEPTLCYSATEALGLIAELEAAAILGGVQRSASDKHLRKLARKSLMRLKSLGLKVDSFLEEERGAFDVSQLTPDTTAAWVSNVDGAGNQMVIFSKSVPMEGLYAIHVITSDKAGIESCMGGRTTGRQSNRFIEGLARESGILLEKSDPDYARYLIQQAKKLNETTDTPVPQEFTTLSFLLGEMEASLSMPSVYELLQFDPATLEDTFVKESEKILKAEEFDSWLLPHETTHRYVEQIKEIEEGWVITSEDVKRDRLKHLLESTTDFLFSVGERQLYKARLEKMAYFLHLREKEDLARDALKVATLLADDSRAPQSISFARHLVARSIVTDIEMHESGHTPEEATEEKDVKIAKETLAIVRASYFGE